MRISNMAQEVQVLAMQTWQPEIYLWNLQRGGRRGSSPKSCPRTSTLAPLHVCPQACANTCTHTHTQIIAYIRNNKTIRHCPVTSAHVCVLHGLAPPSPFSQAQNNRDHIAATLLPKRLSQPWKWMEKAYDNFKFKD